MTKYIIIPVLLFAAVLANAEEIEWIKHTIDPAFIGAWQALPIDMDRDGDFDVVGAAYLGHEIAWWENDGYQGFMDHPVATGFYGVCSILLLI